jgi:hypothetical protein
VFHVELRQFPHQTRAFNLTREELDSRVLRPWVAGSPVEMNDHKWLPDRAKLTIYEGPMLTPDQLGLGRGWSSLTRDGENVTDRLLAEVAHPPPVAELKRELVARCADGPTGISELIALAGQRYPQSRVSERIALCEQAVWELLHEGAVQLARSGAPVPRDGWQDVLLNWETWSDDEVIVERVEI